MLDKKFILNNQSTTTQQCQHATTNQSNAHVGVKQYPWHNLHGYAIEKQGESLIPLYAYLDQETYDNAL